MPYRILAIDYGSKRIGLAITDLLQMFAKPLETIPNQDFEHTLEYIIHTVLKQKIGKIIVGIPLSLEGLDTPKTTETRQFLARLQAALDLPVIGADERYTTVDANDVLKEMGLDWKKSRQVVDALAACLILKRYLEENPDHAKPE